VVTAVDGATPTDPRREKWRTLSDELAELERTDPAVKAAAENYNRVVRKILARAARPADPAKET
jgi:hypothetical protein